MKINKSSEMSKVISIENLWKEYRLGVIGHGTLTHDLQSWWAKVRRKEDPNAKISATFPSQINRVDGDRFWALQDINLEIKHGEVLGIIGKNGAGKSTLLKILSRVTAPSSGCIKVKGRLASLLEVGTGFHPELTGRENIFLNGAILGMSKNEVKNKLEQVVEFSGVSQHIDTPVKRFSSGMYVRLAFAVAAHLEPEILVVDEVLAVGDVEFQKKCLGKMGEVAGGGRTVLFVSHNMGAIQNLCQRAILLEGGKIEYKGNAKTAIQKYLTGNQQLETHTLNERNDRSGSGGVRAINYRFENEEGDICNVLMSGQYLRIIIEYISVGGIKGNVEIYIKTLDGVVLTTFSNLYSGNGVLEFQKNGCIVCEIKKVPLPPGIFTFDIILKSGRRDLLDNVTNVGKIKIDKGDFYSSGVEFKDIRWGLMVDHNLFIQ